MKTTYSRWRRRGLLSPRYFKQIDTADPDSSLIMIGNICLFINSKSQNTEITMESICSWAPGKGKGK